MVARRRDVRRVGEMIAVQIIGLARSQHRMREARHDIVPAHVRDAQPRRGREGANRSADPAEPFVPPMLLTRVGEQLHPDADAEEGRALAANALFHRLDQPGNCR